ncbi:MAG: FAD-binding oxidoreductase [Thermodesulfobacteriota bacterium]|nr:FAD-binding oxidoreductase [Thermodesulfobacteriota bacterium]
MDLKKEMIDIVGAKNVFDSRKILEKYSNDGGIYPSGSPTIVVKPKSTKEVSKITAFANKNSLPVVPVSSEIHFHGTTIPYQGGIVLDLSNMDKILEIDSPNRRVRIEPGVHWEQVLTELEKQDLRIITPLLPHASRSVITDYLEREVPIIPIYEYGEPLLTYEIVWANGEVLRTGSASVPYYPESPAKGTNPAGPGIDFYRLLQGAQGTMGIATWANIKVEYLPKVNKIFFIPFLDLNDAIEPLYRIPRLRIGQECFLLNHLNLAAILAENWPDDFFKLEEVLPTWTLILILSGALRRPEEKIAYEEEALHDLKKEFFPDMKILNALPGIPGGGRELIEMLRKPWPKEITYWKHRLRGGCQSLFFSARPEDAPIYYEKVTSLLAKYGYPVEDMGFYLQPIEQSRACHIEFNLYYNPEEPLEVEIIRNLYRELAEELLDMGALFTRPYGDLADLVYEKAAGYATALKKVKKIFDPNNIMNPGKLCF